MIDITQHLTPERRRFLKFCVVGVLGFVVNESVLWLSFEHLLTGLSPGAATTEFASILASGGGEEPFARLAFETAAPLVPPEFTNTTLFFGGNRLSWAGIIAIAVAIFTNFMLNDSWTWRDRAKGAENPFVVRLAKYYAVASVAGVIQWTVLKVLTESFGIIYLVSNLVGIMAGLSINFLVNNLWTFRENAVTTVRHDRGP